MHAAEVTVDAFVGHLGAAGDTVGGAREAVAGFPTIERWIASGPHTPARCAWGVGALVERGTPYRLPEGGSDLVAILGLWAGEFLGADLIGITVAAGGAGFVVAGAVYPEFGAAVVAKGHGKAAAAAVTTAFPHAGSGTTGPANGAADRAADRAAGALRPLFARITPAGPVLGDACSAARFGSCAEKYYRAKLRALRF